VTQGLSIAAIARRLSMSTDVVASALDAHGIARRPRRRPRMPLDREMLRRLWLEERREESEVAALLGVSREWVREELARQKIRRPRGRPPELPLPGPEVLHELYVRRHLTLDQTAAELACSRNLVVNGLRAAGIPVRPRPGRSPAELTRNVLEELYVRQDLSAQAVAARLGTSAARVRKELRRFGIPVRRAGARPVVAPALPAHTLRRLYVTEGLSVSEIAARYNTTANQVRQRLRSKGIRRPTHRPRPEPPAPPRALLEAFYIGQRLTSEALAKRLHTSAPRVRAWLRAAGIPVNPRTTRATRRDVAAVVLRDLYVTQELTIGQVAQRLKTTPIVVRRSLHAHGIPVRPGGTRPGRQGGSGGGIRVLHELYADPEVVALLRRYGLPRRSRPGPLAMRFPEPIRPNAGLLRDAYEGVGLAAAHIELLTGQPADQILDALHQAGIAVRHGYGASPWRRRLQGQPQRRG
jgi:transposase